MIGRRATGRAPSAIARTWVVVSLALAATAPAALGAATVPPPGGWVTDLAGFLSPDEERALETLMASYKEGSGHEVALLTVPDLGGQALERYALEVARAWRLGEEGRNNGALLLVARSERKIRIEVGRGLEGNLTDSISGRIIRDVIAPDFKRGRFYEGLRAGIEAMHAAAGGDYGKIPSSSHKKRGTASLLVVLLIFFVLSMLGRGGRRGGGGGLLPWILLGLLSSRSGGRSGGWSGGGHSGGGFGGFGGGGGFSGGGASGGW